eukprot:2207832-Alexandrium_andersonii.AAC.1
MRLTAPEVDPAVVVSEPVSVVENIVALHQSTGVTVSDATLQTTCASARRSVLQSPTPALPSSPLPAM